MRALFGYFGCLGLVLTLADCGGDTATGDRAKSPADAERGSANSSEGASKSERGSSEEEPSTTSETPAKSKGPACDDGTCSKCGGGICLAGWYCDEKSNGGGACSWLRECAEKPSCGCITRVLGASCKCREEDGGLKVACD
jgi:hypothetical protein